jgi:hypothetical protein
LRVHPRDTVDKVLALCRTGVTSREISRLTGVPERTVAHWRRGDRRSVAAAPRPSASCPRCDRQTLNSSYAYLLGMFLGDGHISIAQRTACLWIYCADAWPGIQKEVQQAITAVIPSTSVSVAQRTGCIAVKSFTKHRLCLFPQHGPGMKHTRPIVLEPWQEELVGAHTGEFPPRPVPLRRLPDDQLDPPDRRRGGAPPRVPPLVLHQQVDRHPRPLQRVAAPARHRPPVPAPRHDLVARREAVAVLDLVMGPKS